MLSPWPPSTFMPLVVATLQSAILDLCNDPASTAAECAQTFASALGDYTSAIVPASAAVSAAQATLAGALSGAFANPTSGGGIPTFKAALTAFAATVGGGMAPAFVAVPPPVPIAVESLTATDDANAAASSLASLIDTWMKTGTATPSVGGAPVPWT